MAAEQPKVAVVLGSPSDLDVVKKTVATLKEFGVPHEVKILSAHRSPHKTAEYAESASGRGVKVIIAAAGGAAHLAGVIAGHSTLPVIGIPMPSKYLKGLDSLLSIVQMPSGVPVATVAIGEAGATNAAILAVQILALSDSSYSDLLDKHKISLVKKIEKANADLTI